MPNANTILRRNKLRIQWNSRKFKNTLIINYLLITNKNNFVGEKPLIYFKDTLIICFFITHRSDKKDYYVEKLF
jgi:hypothetical protein